MKKELLIAASAAVVAGSVVADANAIDVELYGQVNKGVMMADDGKNTSFNVVDNAFSSTRVGVKGEQALDNGLTASALVEFEFNDNASNALSNDDAGALTKPRSTDSDIATRHARVGIASDFGALFIGKTSTATDGVTEQDLAGANDVLGADFTKIGGGLSFQKSGVLVSGPMNESVTSMDGLGRANVVRYDSPIFSGFQLRTSVAQGGNVDVGAFYKAKFDAIALAAAIGYVNPNSSVDVGEDSGIRELTGTARVSEQWSGSVSVKHDNGLGLTAAYGKQKTKGEIAPGDSAKNPQFWYVKAGYTWDAFELAADYGENDDVAGIKSAKVKYYGVGGQYNLSDSVATSVYYKNFEGKLGVSSDDIQVYGVNFRVKF